MDDARAATPEVLRRYIEQQSNWTHGKDEGRIAYEMAFQESILSNFWGTLYEKTNDENYLREAVRIGLGAVQSLKDTDHYERPSILEGASTWLLLQFLNEGNTQDLIECIKMRKMALDPPPDDIKARGRLEYQKNQALRFMYDHTNDEKYLLEALDAQQKLVDDQIELHNYLNLDELNLLIGLYCSNFNRAKELSHLQNALRWGDIAVRAAQSGTSVECWYVRATHSMTLYFHYRHAREYKSLERALELSKKVLLESKVRNKKERATDFANNAVMLIAKYERDKQKDPQNPLACLGLVDEAIESIEDGIRTLQSTGVVRRSEELVILAGLHDKAGSYFGEKFRATGNPLFGSKAIEHAEKSVEIIPKDHPHRPFHLSNLAANLVSMYHFESQPAEKKPFATPDKARTAVHEAVFENQASMFENENLATLEKALTASREAVETTSGDDPELAQRLNNLGIIEILQGLNIHSKGKHFPKARDHFLKAARHEFAHPLVRISAGLRVGRMFLQGRDPKMADDVLQEVMSLIPSISPRSNSAEDLQDVLTGVTGLSNLAAAAALEAGSSSEEAAWKALQTLESGRCVIAGLRMSASTANSADDGSKLSGGRDEIIGLASQGPIITFNVERARSDAIIVTSKGVKVLSLPDLKYGELEKGLQVILNGGAHSSRKATTASEDSLAKSPFALFQELGVSDQMIEEAVTLDTEETRAHASEERHIRVKVKREDRTVDGFLKWIWKAAVKPVLDAIDDTEMQPSRRVWWVTSGLMGLAPIHAAGFHAKGSRDNTMSRVVSSYISSFKALKFARERKSVTSPGLKMLEITMPTSPSGHGNLNIAFEEQAIQDVFKENVTKLVHPTPKQVLEHLPTHSFAHFACHGLSVPGDPSQSGLLLVEDGNAAILTVGDLEQVNLEQAQIAYLSACSTAELSNVRLMDEAIHLANAFQIAGFQHVVGTVWAANDEAAGQIARRFYASLFELGTDENGEQQVARAVHKAVVEYRDSAEVRRDIWKWAPFIHIGL